MSAATATGMRKAHAALRLDVIENGSRIRSGWTPCVIGRDVQFSTEGLETYCLGNWEPLIYDAFLLAAAIEYCDRAVSRKALDWKRFFELRLPVHDPERWNEPQLVQALVSALGLLTGDSWTITYVARRAPAETPGVSRLGFPNGAAAILAYSDGLDSRAVRGLFDAELGDGLVRVRLGSVGSKRDRARPQPFARIPYDVAVNGGARESSVRSRGFKFAMVAAVAAYLSNALRIIVPESAQGALGPVLVPVGQAHEDYRNHPEFTALMFTFLRRLIGRDIQFEFPRLWNTKGETLKACASLRKGADFWSDTRSCWQQSRQVSWEGRRRQCGICAACLLRRMSMHAAGLKDEDDAFIWQNLSARDFKEGAAPGFGQITEALRQYGIAGVLHLDHLAALTEARHAGAIEHYVFRLARTLGLPEQDVREKLKRVLSQHREEWHAFMGMVGSQSFLADWASGAR